MATPMMLAVLYIDTWLLANPHLVATYTRIRAVSLNGRAHWALVLFAPVLILIGVTMIALAYEVAGLFALYFLLQAFHVARQSYGIARRHDHRPQALRQGLPYWLIHLIPAWGYLHRSAQAPDNFLGYPIWLPPVPQALVDAVGLVAVIAAVCWLARLASSRGEARANGVFNSFVLSHVIVSAVGYLWISDITVGWLVVNVWHNFQYLVFVDRQRRSAAVESAAGLGRNSDSAASSSKRLQAPAMFFLVCSACGALLYVTASHVGERLLWLGLPTILIAHFVLNFHHYLADSIVWKRRFVSHLEPARADR